MNNMRGNPNNSSLMSKDRVESFSDGVFAIVMTLLVLELHVPEIADHSSFGQYATVMAPLIPKFVSFVLSFVMVSIYWVNHHYFFRHLRSVPLGLVWLNNLFLLSICFLPFPTAFVGDHPTDQFPILLYGVNSLISTLAIYGLRGYASYRGLFTVDRESAKVLGPRNSIPAIVIYLLSIFLVFVNVYLSLGCFLLVPVLYFVPNLIRFQ